jgi:hypothetical protein
MTVFGCLRSQNSEFTASRCKANVALISTHFMGLHSRGLYVIGKIPSVALDKIMLKQQIFTTVGVFMDF